MIGKGIIFGLFHTKLISHHAIIEAYFYIVVSVYVLIIEQTVIKTLGKKVPLLSFVFYILIILIDFDAL